MTKSGAAIFYALIAAGAGVAVMAAAGAPTMSLAIQGFALLVGLWGARLLARIRRPVSDAVALAGLALGAILIGLPLLVGPDIDGVRRWLAVGPLLIQPAMIVLPPMIWLYVSRPAAKAETGFGMVAALALALQPDAAGAAALAGGLAACAIMRRRTPDIAAAAVALAAFAWASTRIDPLAPVPHVEQAAETAFVANPVLGGVAWIILLSLPVPFLLAERREAAHVALAACWVGLVAAAVFGNYPQPIIGYSASLALGWMISLGLAARTPQEPA